MGVLLVGGVIGLTVVGLAALIVVRGTDPKRDAARRERERQRQRPSA